MEAWRVRLPSSHGQAAGSPGVRRRAVRICAATRATGAAASQAAPAQQPRARPAASPPHTQATERCGAAFIRSPRGVDVACRPGSGPFPVTRRLEPRGRAPFGRTATGATSATARRPARPARPRGDRRDQRDRAATGATSATARRPARPNAVGANGGAAERGTRPGRRLPHGLTGRAPAPPVRASRARARSPGAAAR